MKNNELVEKFNESEAMALLSNKDKKIILEAIEEGSKEVIDQISKLLEVENLLTQYIKEQALHASEEIVNSAIKDFRKIKNTRQEISDARKAAKILKLLN